MKKSTYNRRLLDNFVLWKTHFNREEAESLSTDTITEDRIEQFNTAKELYEDIDGYIWNDHVDGLDGDDGQIKADFYGDN